MARVRFHEWTERSCKACGATFKIKITPSVAKYNRGIFCSKECNNKWKHAPIEERFKRYLNPIDENGCITWNGNTDEWGYGRIMSGKGRGENTEAAHRFSYELNIGPIPEGMKVLHKCDNPPCVNHEHLFLGTDQDNMDDKMKKGRHKSSPGEKNGSVKIKEDIVISIREEYAKGGVRYKDLALKHGLDTSMIGYIVKRKNWKHI